MHYTADSAVEKWLAKYGGRFRVDGDDRVLRFDTILSRLQSSSLPYLPEVLREGLMAWKSVGCDPLDFHEFRYEAEDVLAGPDGGKVKNAID